MKRVFKIPLVLLGAVMLFSACSYDVTAINQEGLTYLKSKYPNHEFKVRGIKPNNTFKDAGYSYLVEDTDMNLFFVLKSTELNEDSKRVFEDDYIDRLNSRTETAIVKDVLKSLLPATYHISADMGVYEKTALSNQGNLSSKGDLSLTKPLALMDISENDLIIRGGTVYLVVSDIINKEHAQKILDTLNTHFGDVTLIIYTYYSDEQVEYVKHLNLKEGLSIVDSAPSHTRVSSDMYYYEVNGEDIVFTHVENVK